MKNRNLFREAEFRNEYCEALETVVHHRHLAAHLRLSNHVRLHRLTMAVLARLADYAGLWERDLYFVVLALVRLEGKKPEEVFGNEGTSLLRDGRIVDAVKKIRENGDGSGKAIVQELRKLFGEGFLDNRDGVVRVRRDLLHFNMLQRKENAVFDLTAAVNDTRRLMDHDHKLKNAVSRSVVELLAREGLVLEWRMQDHDLVAATVTSRQACHLGGKDITEDLHGPEFVAMTATLFGGEARSPTVPPGSAAGGTKPGTRPVGRLPEAGRRVQAVLVEEKTKKGGWKAAVVADGRRIVGDISNSGKVPPDATPGQAVELVVRVANPGNASFEWPSPDVEARLAKKAASRRGKRPKDRRR